MEEFSCYLGPLDGAGAIRITQQSYVDMFKLKSLLLLSKVS